MKFINLFIIFAVATYVSADNVYTLHSNEKCGYYRTVTIIEKQCEFSFYNDKYKELSIVLNKSSSRSRKKWSPVDNILLHFIYRVEEGKLFYLTNLVWQDALPCFPKEKLLFCLNDTIGAIRNTSSSQFEKTLETTLVGRTIINGDTLYKYKLSDLTSDDGYINSLTLDKKFTIKEISYSTYNMINPPCIPEKTINFN